jgi:hypothetical protein
MSARGERAGRVLLALGIVVAALALAAVLGLFWYFSLPIDHGSLSADTTVRGGLFLTENTVSEGGVVLAAPAGMLLVASCLLFPGYFLTRGRMGLSTGSRLGGSVTARYRVLGTRAHLTWIAIAVALWIGLLVVPLASGASGGWPASVEEDARQYIYILSGIYGGLAAGLAALLGVSLVKKRRFLAMAEAADARLETADAAKAFWRWYGYRWRIDGWLAMVGGILVGVSVLAFAVGTPLFFGVTLAVGVALVAIAVITALQFWRAGEAIGSAEGFA